MRKHDILSNEWVHPFDLRHAVLVWSEDQDSSRSNGKQIEQIVDDLYVIVDPQTPGARDGRQRQANVYYGMS